MTCCALVPASRIVPSPCAAGLRHGPAERRGRPARRPLSRQPTALEHTGNGLYQPAAGALCSVVCCTPRRAACAFCLPLLQASGASCGPCLRRCGVACVSPSSPDPGQHLLSSPAAAAPDPRAAADFPGPQLLPRPVDVWVRRVVRKFGFGAVDVRVGRCSAAGLQLQPTVCMHERLQVVPLGCLSSIGTKSNLLVNTVSRPPATAGRWRRAWWGGWAPCPPSRSATRCTGRVGCTSCCSGTQCVGRQWHAALPVAAAAANALGGSGRLKRCAACPTCLVCPD